MPEVKNPEVSLKEPGFEQSPEMLREVEASRAKSEATLDGASTRNPESGTPRESELKREPRPEKPEPSPESKRENDLDNTSTNGKVRDTNPPEDFGAKLRNTEIDAKYNKVIEGDPAKEKLPACFDGLSEESKAKQYEALDKMSGEERKSYFDIIKKEPAITADVKDVANENGGELQGLEYRVKTPSSTYEKMHEREEGTDIGEMKDVIRYTEIYPPDKLAEGTNASLQAFEEKGYTVAKVKNTWDDENSAYKGINSTIVSPEGQAFEVQFHTQESFELKNGELHSLYEERRVLSAKDPKGLELDDKMFELSDGLTRPYSIEEVKNK